MNETYGDDFVLAPEYRNFNIQLDIALIGVIAIFLATEFSQAVQFAVHALANEAANARHFHILGDQGPLHPCT